MADSALDRQARRPLNRASERARLGFIGMGGMGSRMAARLLAAGYDYRLIVDTAMSLPAAMPATVAAPQGSAAELARQSAAGRDEDFSSVVRTMERS